MKMASNCIFRLDFLHGFQTLMPNTEIVYKCSNYYSASHEITVTPQDRTLGIEWPLGIDDSLMSQKDKEGALLAFGRTGFIWGKLMKIFVTGGGVYWICCCSIGRVSWL